MYLKGIVASGFKSFADKIELKLDGRTTCIVGPNGSGKSNIVDAVRWVLGEQSVKSLRGDGSMSDVIFSGSKSRNPLNVASVELIFDNNDHFLNVPYTEISIKRKVYRSGENEYYLNNEKCRLKDINNLLMDTGMGKESFNIISQGEVDKILSNSATDRRVIFEEASGILKYKKRKEEALRKLDKTHNNLDRLNDIIQELDLQIGPLKEQSKKASEYLENKKGLDKYEVSLLAYDIENLNSEQSNFKTRKEKLDSEILTLQTHATKNDTKYLEDNNRLEKLETEKSNLQRELLKVTEEKEKIDGERNLLKERSKTTKEEDEIKENIRNVLSIDEKYVKALNTAISTSKNFIITKDEASAKLAITYLKDSHAGRATFFPISVIKERYVDYDTINILKNSNDFVGIMSDLVKYNKEYENIIKNQLGIIVVATTIDAATRLSHMIKARYKIVTLEGDLINVGGSLTGGSNYIGKSSIILKQEITHLEKTFNLLKQEEAEIQTSLQDNSKEITAIEEKIYSISKDKVALKEKYDNKKSELIEIKNKLISITKEYESLELINNNGVSEKEQELIRLFHEKTALKEQIENHITSISKEISNLKEKQEAYQAEEKLKNSQLHSKEKESRDLEIKINRNDVKLDNMLSILNSEYEMTYERAKAEYSLDIEPEEARLKVNTYKANIKRIGMVNLDSIEEYERVNTRYEFLNNQKSDLLNAEDSLLEIMNEMDEVMKEEFKITFENIRVEFQKVFKELFMGGNADLKLTNPEDLLSTGVDIVASPPGKKLTTISLLSGGEKTLTAISLLFAILNVRTVPFCLFDEVEAALDEANVAAFGRYLNHYRDKTQFLIITHKKKTMEYAHTLYGITMQESGVSKLVSVKLEDHDEVL